LDQVVTVNDMKPLIFTIETHQLILFLLLSS